MFQHVSRVTNLHLVVTISWFSVSWFSVIISMIVTDVLLRIHLFLVLQRLLSSSGFWSHSETFIVLVHLSKFISSLVCFAWCKSDLSLSLNYWNHCIICCLRFRKIPNYSRSVDHPSLIRYFSTIKIFYFSLQRFCIPFCFIILNYAPVINSSVT